MNYCIIAVKDDNQYKSIMCHYSKDTNLGAVLRRKFNSLEAANRLINLGDLSHLDGESVKAFHQDGGYTWNESRPVEHNMASLLIPYCEAIGADKLFVYENLAWKSFTISAQSLTQPLLQEAV